MPNSYDAQVHGLAKRMIAITIHPFSLARIRHLKSAHDGFKTLSKLFEKPAPTPTTTYNIRTVADTRQKPSEGSCNVRDRETATNKADSAIVEEPHDVRCRKHERDTGSHGRVETWGREGKRAAGCMSEQGAAARGPGEGATDLKASGIGLAIMPSSQEDDTGVRCTPVIPQEPQMTSGRAGDASADAVNPRATSARPTEPAGASHNPQVELHEIAGSDNARGERPTTELMRRASEKVAAARGPGEDAMDQTADGMSLRASQLPRAARMMTHTTTSQQGDRTSMDETTNEITAPLSMPLEGERDSQATSGSTRAHSEGAEPPDGTADAQDGTQTQRCAKGTRTGQQHNASAHGEGRSRKSLKGSSKTWVDAPSPARQIDPQAHRSSPTQDCRRPGRTRQAQHAGRQTPSTPLEGERGHQPSSDYTDDRTIAHEHRDESEVELEGGRMHTSAAPPNASATVVHSPANAPRGLFEGEQGGWKSTSHTHERSTTHQRCHKDRRRKERTRRPQNGPDQPRCAAALHQAKPGTGVMKTVSVSDPSSSKVLSLADSDLYSSVSSGAHEESPESGGDSAFRGSVSLWSLDGVQLALNKLSVFKVKIPL
ncbi:hypothetical protein BU15DRAFT_69165, partial [Melanogaster broomeanus]